jgi:hypothetical protein
VASLGCALALVVATDSRAQEFDYQAQSGTPALFLELTRLTCAEATATITGQRTDARLRLLIFGIIAGEIAGSVLVDEGDGLWMQSSYGLQEYWLLKRCEIMPEAPFLEAGSDEQWDR